MTFTGLGRRRLLAGALALGGCQAPPAGTASSGQTALPAGTAPRLGPDRTGYVSLEAPILNGSRDAFITDVNKLLALDARQVEVLITSPGGLISAAEDMVAFMDRTHAERGVSFVTYNIGTVSSAACYVFLAGQRRLSIPRGTFMFHEAMLVANGIMTSQALQQANDNMQRIESSFLTMLTAKTRLTRAEAESFVKRTVILNALEAQRDGVIDASADFVLPPGATVFRIQLQRPAPAEATPPRPVQPG